MRSPVQSERLARPFFNGLVLLICGAVATAAYADVPLAAMHISTGRMDLTQSTTWVASNLNIDDGALIVTNGHPLTILVLGDLKINGSATILSFDPAAQATSSGVPAKASRALRSEL